MKSAVIAMLTAALLAAPGFTAHGADASATLKVSTVLNLEDLKKNPGTNLVGPATTVGLSPESETKLRQAVEEAVKSAVPGDKIDYKKLQEAVTQAVLLGSPNDNIRQNELLGAQLKRLIHGKSPQAPRSPAPRPCPS